MAIADIHAASWWNTYRDVLPRSYLESLHPDKLEPYWLKRLRRERARKTTWVIEDTRGVAGFVVLGPCRSDAELVGFAGEVYMLYVSPDRVGEGFGRALLDASLAEIERRGFYWAVIWVVKANRNAQAFYRHMGLRNDTGFRWDEFHGRRVAVVRYAKPLNCVLDFSSLSQSPISE